MKILFFLIALLLIPISSVFAYGSLLQDSTLTVTSTNVSLELEIGQDTFQPLISKIITTNNLSNIVLSFYGDEIDMSDSKLKIYSNSAAFSIKNIEQGIVMYGLKTSDTESYRINIYYSTNNGLQKFTVYGSFEFEDEKVIETIEKTIEEPKENKYIPELLIVESHDFSTYWKDTFNIDVKTYDGKINSKGTGFEGKLNDVDITIIISLGDEVITTLKGITENGVWVGDHYIQENLVQAGEYTIDVLATFGNQAVSKTSSMFIIGTVSSSGGSFNYIPVTFAGNDGVGFIGVLFTLDGSGSSDSNGDTLTYSWTQITSIAGVFVDTTTETPDFTPSAIGTAIFELRVTDSKGASSTDTVSIVISQIIDSP